MIKRRWSYGQIHADKIGKMIQRRWRYGQIPLSYYCGGKSRICHTSREDSQTAIMRPSGDQAKSAKSFVLVSKCCIWSQIQRNSETSPRYHDRLKSQSLKYIIFCVPYGIHPFMNFISKFTSGPRPRLVPPINNHSPPLDSTSFTSNWVVANVFHLPI